MIEIGKNFIAIKEMYVKFSKSNLMLKFRHYRNRCINLRWMCWTTLPQINNKSKIIEKFIIDLCTVYRRKRFITYRSTSVCSHNCTCSIIFWMCISHFLPFLDSLWPVHSPAVERYTFHHFQQISPPLSFTDDSWQPMSHFPGRSRKWKNLCLTTVW